MSQSKITQVPSKSDTVEKLVELILEKEKLEDHLTNLEDQVYVLEKAQRSRKD